MRPVAGTGSVDWKPPSWVGIHPAKRGYALQARDSDGRISKELARTIGEDVSGQPLGTARQAVSQLCLELTRNDGLLSSKESIDRIAANIYRMENIDDAAPAWNFLSEEDKSRFRRVAERAIEVAGLGSVVDQEPPSLIPKYQDPKRFLPEHPEAQEYYEALRQKHFSPDGVGSRFTGGFGLEQLVMDLPDISEEKPLSEQDDRAYFEAQGITGLKEDLGYFRIEGARGLTRLVPDSELEPDAEIEIEEVKPGFLSFITLEEREVPVPDGTLIIGKNPRGDTPFQVVTAFPGLPWEPEKSGISVDEAEAKGITPGSITLARLKELVGQDLLLQSR